MTVDFLTVTMRGEGEIGSPAGGLIEYTRPDEPGRGCPGFRASEKRLALGGICWRRTDPVQRSQQFGDRYESWQFPGESAASAARWLRGKGELRPSMVHVAFDLAVSDDLMAEHFGLAVRPHVHERGMVDGEVRDGAVTTWYIGSKSSDRRVRVYRKDLQNEVIAAFIGPSLRVELVLKGDQAAAWWRVWEEDPDRAFRVAAAHLCEMTGVQLLDELAPIPELVLPEEADLGKQLALFVQQHGTQVAGWTAAGVDLVALCVEHAKINGSRSTAWRWGKRIEAARAVGVAGVVRLARVLLGLGDR